MKARLCLLLALSVFGCVSDGWTSVAITSLPEQGILGSTPRPVQPTIVVLQSPPVITETAAAPRPIVSGKTVACLAGAACCGKGCQECGRGCGKLCCGLWDCTKGAAACTAGLCICCVPVCDSLGNCLFRTVRWVTRGCLGAICKPTPPEAPKEWPVLNTTSKGSVNLELFRPFFYGPNQHYLWYDHGDARFRNTLSFSQRKKNRLSSVSSDQWPAMIAGVEDIVLTFPLDPRPLKNLMPASVSEEPGPANGYVFHLRGTLNSKRGYQFANVMKAWSKEGQALCTGLDIAAFSSEDDVLPWFEYFMEQPAVQLRYLSIRFLSVTDGGLQRLYKALAINSRFLETLDLSLNELTGASMGTSLGWCCKENPGGIISFVRDTEKFPNLQNIKLFGNPLGNKKSDAIFSASGKRQNINRDFRIHIGFNGTDILSWVKGPSVEFATAPVLIPQPTSSDLERKPTDGDDTSPIVSPSLVAAPPPPTITPYFRALSDDIFGEFYQNVGSALWNGGYDPILQEDPSLAVLARWPETLQLMVSARPNFHTLILDGTRLNMFFLESLLFHLDPKQLTKLSLKGAFGDTGESLLPVLGQMQRFTKLTFLELGDNFLDGNFPTNGEILKAWPNLAYLGLSGNNLGRTDVRSLLQNVQSLPSLLLLDLSRNELNDEHLPLIYDTVDFLTSLALLDLSGNQLSLKSYSDWFMPLFDGRPLPDQKGNPLVSPRKSKKGSSRAQLPIFSAEESKPLPGQSISDGPSDLPGSVPAPGDSIPVLPYQEEALPIAPSEHETKERHAKEHHRPLSLEIIKLAENPLDTDVTATIEAFYTTNSRAPLPLLTVSRPSGIVAIGNWNRYRNVSHMIGTDRRLPLGLLATLPVLELRNTIPSFQTMVILARMFSRNSLITLDMSKNILDASEKVTLNMILLGNPGLRELHLSHMNLGPTLAEDLPSLASLIQLTVLDLGHNNLEEKGLRKLAPFIQNFSNLRKISLQGNQLGKGIPCLTNGLKLLNTALTAGPEGLFHINLSDNSLGFREIKSLKSGLERQHDLKVLKIGLNPLDINGSRLLANLIMTWPSLREFHASHIKMGAEGAKSLIAPLKTLRDLQLVVLDHELTVADAEILEPLKHVPNLIFLPAA